MTYFHDVNDEQAHYFHLGHRRHGAEVWSYPWMYCSMEQVIMMWARCSKWILFATKRKKDVLLDFLVSRTSRRWIILDETEDDQMDRHRIHRYLFRQKKRRIAIQPAATNVRHCLPDDDIVDVEEDDGEEGFSGPLLVETSVRVGPFVSVNGCSSWSSTNEYLIVSERVIYVPLVVPFIKGFMGIDFDPVALECERFFFIEDAGSFSWVRSSTNS